MSDLYSNAILLLRYMFEKSIIAPKGISPEELQAAAGINHEEFDTAENYTDSTILSRELPQLSIRPD